MKYYFDILDKDFDLPVFFIEYPDDIVIHHKEGICMAMMESLKLLIDNPDWKTVPSFILEDEESKKKGDQIVLELDREEVDEYIDNCLEYFKGVQDFETCVELDSMRKQLSDG